MKAFRPVVIAMLALVAAASPSVAQGTSWKGEEVLPVKSAKEIRIGDTINGRDVYFPYDPVALAAVVRDEKEGWLRLYDGHREGWVDKADFVLVRDAPAYFHRRVVANPSDRWARYMRAVGWLRKGEPDMA